MSALNLALLGPFEGSLNGNPLVKFRTMRNDAEKANEPVWSVRGDPRRTRLGAFMRRWNLPAAS